MTGTHAKTSGQRKSRLATNIFSQNLALDLTKLNTFFSNFVFKVIADIREACRAEVDALWDQVDDIIGDYRICRFLRAQGGDFNGAVSCFKAFLKYRLQDDHLVERLRREVVENQIDCQG